MTDEEQGTIATLPTRWVRLARLHRLGLTKKALNEAKDKGLAEVRSGPDGTWWRRIERQRA